MTMGMAIMYSPFFLIGHTIATYTDYPTDGYSYPYSVCLKIGTCCYMILALLLLYSVLSHYFNKLASFITIGVLFLGTNLFYYTLGEGEMSHAYIFFLFTLVIWATIKWYTVSRLRYLILISLASGMAVLIRPTSVLILLFPLLININSIDSLKHRLELFNAKKIQLLYGGIIFIIPFFIQMIFWKVQTGQWLVWSYKDEQFYFSNAHVYDFLIGFRKGWFIYTPIMLIACIGLFLMKGQLKRLRLSITLIVILSVYILSSWWCWWFGGSLGSRSMIDYYSLLSIPLGALIWSLLRFKIVFYSLLTVFVGLIGYNLMIQKKYPNGLHWDAMTKESFFISIQYINNMPDDVQAKYEKALDHPNYDKARNGR